MRFYGAMRGDAWQLIKGVIKKVIDQFKNCKFFLIFHHMLCSCIRNQINRYQYQHLLNMKYL